MSVTFDGPNKLIIADPGTTTLNVSVDIYSAWKEWVAIGDNSKYDQAIRVVGGEPTIGGNSIAGYFFLMNGWRVRPQEANHTLVIDGILLVDGGGDPFVNTLGTYNVRINMTTPLQAETIEVGTSGLTPEESNQLLSISTLNSSEIAEAVWAKNLNENQSEESAGRVLASIQEAALRIQNIEEGSWKINGTQMVFYQPNGVTEIARFDLLGQNGEPTIESVFERRRVV